LTENIEEYYSHGKLLLTGEYLVLYGAEALGIPLKKGQKLIVKPPNPEEENLLKWKALSPSKIWFEGVFKTKNFSIVNSSDQIFAKRLQDILLKIRKQNPKFLKNKGAQIETKLEFNPDFGFGSSSTLIIDLSKWANVDPFKLQKDTFKGSGYDIACGMSETAVIYKLEGKKSVFENINFNPSFPENIFFVYLGKKQKSLNEITKFKKQKNFTEKEIEEISEITRQVIEVKTLEAFEILMSEHEKIISKVLGIKTVKETLFNDYNDGIVKSLGAWGGDFVLVTSKMPAEKFKQKMKNSGFGIVFGYNELVL